MKRLLATMICLGLAGTAQAQLALETFEGGTFPPTGWSVLDNTSNGA